MQTHILRLHKFTVVISTALSIGCGLLFLYLFFSFHGGNLPHVAQPETGRVFESNNHGSVVFLNEREHYSLIALQAGVVIFGLIGLAINRKYKAYVP